jgi:hypothetical protein
MKSTLLFFIVVVSVVWAETKPESFTGEIVDSSCAYNIHSVTRSHKEMLKSKSFGNTAAECTRLCVRKFGSSYVLVHNNDVYRLAPQSLAEPLAGEAVRISGTLDNDGKTIHIEKVEPAK